MEFPEKVCVIVLGKNYEITEFSLFPQMRLSFCCFLIHPWSILKREKIEITAQKGLSKDVWEDKEKSGMFEEIEKTWVF